MLVFFLRLLVLEDTSIDSYPEIDSVVDNTSIDPCLLHLGLDEVYISPEDTNDISDVVDALMESNTFITDEINVHEDNQGSQGNEVESLVATPSVSFSSESLKFLIMLHQVSFGVSSFSECLEFSPEFLQISVS